MNSSKELYDQRGYAISHNVSETKNSQPRFSVGEDVLCFEPDIDRTRLLYRSRILKNFVKDCEDGSKTEYYRMHFHGWSNAWNRDVTVDYILKDTAANRQLKKKLAHEARISELSSKKSRKYRLLKNKRRKVVRYSIPEHHNVSEEGRIVSNDQSKLKSRKIAAPKSTLKKTVPAVEVCSHHSADSEIIYTNRSTIFPPSEKTARDMDWYIFNNNFISLVGHDHYLIEDKKWLIDLPADPNAVNIFAHYLMYFANNDLKEYASKYPNSNYQDMIARINLCKEFIDNMRTCFDKILPGMLLFKEEISQFGAVDRAFRNVNDDSFIFDTESLIPRYDKFPKVVVTDENMSSTRAGKFSEPCCSQNVKSKNFLKQKDESKGRSKLARNAGTSKIVSRYSLRFNACNIYEQNINSMISDHIESWSVVPKELIKEKPYNPSCIFGAVHLARFLVKFPDILPLSTVFNAANRLIILTFFESFMKFLCEHEEWFDEKHYKPQKEAKKLSKIYAAKIV